MRRAILLLSLAVFFLAFSPARAEACSCMVPGPPCQEAWESPLVFAGTVIEVDQQPGTLLPRRVRFRITEAFRGTEQGEIDIHLRGGGDASCDPPFRMGESWLVYGNNRWEGGPGWTASICSRTIPLRAAAEDLAYLRIPDAKKPPSHITGRVTKYVYDPSPGKEGRSVGIAGVPVIVTGRTTRLEAQTDAEGRYSIPVESGSAYQVDFGRVEGLSIRGSGQQIWLPHYRACAMANAGVAYDGRVSGQIVDALGLPVPFLPITLASSPRYLQRHTLTDADGRFQFDIRYPGPHVVTLATGLTQDTQALPLTLAPLSVPAAGHVDAGQLRMPSSLKRTLVEILIEDSAGNPAAGAHVSFRQPDVFNADSYAPDPRADEKGAFRISLVAGQRLEVSAQYSRKTPAESVHEEGTVVIHAPGLIRMRLAPFR